jgi:hypothetical protein
LEFELWAGDNGDEAEVIASETAHKMAQVKDWELACPKLNTVTFMDGSTLEKGGEVWRLL